MLRFFFSLIIHKFDKCKKREAIRHSNSAISRSDFNYRCIFMCMLDFFLIPSIPPPSQLSLGTAMENDENLLNMLFIYVCECMTRKLEPVLLVDFADGDGEIRLLLNTCRTFSARKLIALRLSGREFSNRRNYNGF